jgi:hypothetical protein
VQQLPINTTRTMPVSTAEHKAQRLLVATLLAAMEPVAVEDSAVPPAGGGDREAVAVEDSAVPLAAMEPLAVEDSAALLAAKEPVVEDSAALLAVVEPLAVEDSAVPLAVAAEAAVAKTPATSACLLFTLKNGWGYLPRPFFCSCRHNHPFSFPKRQNISSAQTET